VSRLFCRLRCRLLISFTNRASIAIA